ncbi:MAG: response regulator [Desulfuromonadales bacterium]|nr:response regulator [Desulfuromonadales bacterium]
MKFRTIIFDDDETIRHLLQVAAEQRGHEVLTFPSPQICSTAAGEICSRQRPCCDIIISDQGMPEMTGLEFFARLQQRRCAIKNRALVTASAWEEISTLAKGLPFDYFHKPFFVSELMSWLERSEANVPSDRELLALEEFLFPDREAAEDPSTPSRPLILAI